MAAMIGGIFTRVVVLMMTVSVVMLLVMIMRMVGCTRVLMIGSDRRRLASLQIEHCCFAVLASAIRAHQRTSSSSIDLTFSSSPLSRVKRNEPHGQGVSIDGVGNSASHASQRAID